MKGILGKKIGMTQVFAKNGKLIPVTVVVAEPNVVMQIKTKETDGYEAIQLGFVSKKEKYFRFFRSTAGTQNQKWVMRKRQTLHLSAS